MVSTSEKAGQFFKSIYFHDLVDGEGRRQCLTLAFPADDTELWKRVSHLSSVEVRSMIGHRTIATVKKAAAREQRSVNAYCLGRLGRHSGKAGLKGSIDMGVQATFRGGKDEPMHGWFPYLEGYSPEFVRQMLSRYAPDARNVLDPFGGVGTTPLTAASLGLQAMYCEVNPLLQQLIRAKADALGMTGEERRGHAAELEKLAARLEHDCHGFPTDAALRQTYTDTFVGSEFFDPPVFETVLRLRSFLDHLQCGDQAHARFAEVAATACLLKASRLIRRGDVRFKTRAELVAGTEDLLEAMIRHLLLMASDLRALPAPCDSPPALLCADARNLTLLPEQDIHAVLTSPPYINGTNYFRNTKVELWFMRCLRHGADLGAFRARAITGGINDVTKGKTWRETPAQAEKVVAELEKSAYDRRIPIMVAGYFADMAEVMDGMDVHLVPGAPVMIDIGDSNYGGVHVPAEKVLKEMFAERGYQLVEDLTLRRRASRGGRELRQAMLVFKKSTARNRALCLREETGSVPWWNTRWQKFKKELPHQHGVFAKRNWGHGLHSLCSYQGKMKPSIAHFLTRIFVPESGSMLDPFGGVGTLPLEAALQGMRTWTFDISPAALCIARAKLGRPSMRECDQVLGAIEAWLDEARPAPEDSSRAALIRFNGPLESYFEPKTFEEILKVRRWFLTRPPRTDAEALVLACLLHILHGNRPYALSRRSHPITPFAPTGDFEYRALLPRLREKIARTLDAELPPEFVTGQVLRQDACGFWPQEVRELDAVITSPPFYDSTRFYLSNWMRLWFCGWEAEDFKEQPKSFVDERQKKSLDIYEPVFRQARERLKPGGVFVLHLGESRKCDMAAHLRHIARRWFRVADLFSESVSHCESHGIRDKGTVTAHQFLVLE